jgi:hypothetical protein
VIAETRDFDTGFCTSLENGVGTVDHDRLVVDEYLELFSSGSGRSEHPCLVLND